MPDDQGAPLEGVLLGLNFRDQLRQWGGRRDGDPTFRDPVEGDAREIAISTLETEPVGSPAEILCTLPFLRIVPAGVDGTHRPEEDGVVLRVHRYRVEFATTPKNAFQGEVLVRDPWVPGRELRLIARVEVTPPLRAVPSRLVLRPGSETRGTILVFATGPARGASLSVEPAEEDSPLRDRGDREGELPAEGGPQEEAWSGDGSAGIDGRRRVEEGVT